MPANFKPIFPVAPAIGVASLTSPTAVTSRANISGASPANLTSLTPATTNGRRIDKIEVTAKGTSSNASLFIWMHDGSTAWVMDEIVISSITPTNTLPSFTTSVEYTSLVLPPTYRLWVSVTVAQDLNVFAFGGDY